MCTIGQVTVTVWFEHKTAYYPLPVQASGFSGGFLLFFLNSATSVGVRSPGNDNRKDCINMILNDL